MNKNFSLCLTAFAFYFFFSFAFLSHAYAATYNVSTTGNDDLLGDSSATSTPPPPASTKFSIGDRVQVSSELLNVRSTPSTSGTLLVTQATGTPGTVVAGPTAADGLNWWQINYDTGADGWSVEDYLVKVTVTPPSPPPPLPPIGTANTYYVAKNGNDNTGSGSFSSPWQTIQKCATSAVAGDTCYIRAGIYRETITPVNSGTPSAPITFAPYNRESVTISGADVVTGWSSHSGSIYRSQGMNWNLGQGNNQIFVDGQMMTEARWPNTGTDLSNPTWAVASGGSSDDSHIFGSPIDPNERWTITDPALNQPAGFWNGALINHMGKYAIVAQSGIVTSYAPGSVTLSLLGNRYGVGANVRYYLTGILGALDTAREWFFDPAISTIYLWTPAGDNPSSHTVEAKRRMNAFDLSGKSNISIGAFNIFAAGIKSDMNSSRIFIDGINASYVSHFTRIEGPAQYAGWDTGIMLHGSNNTLQNCTIAYSAANGVDLLGTNHKVTNCTIHDVDYTALDGAAVYTYNRADSRIGFTGYVNSGHEISHNTLYNSGRSLVGHSHTQSLKILYNHIYNAGLQTNDMGFTYAWGTDGAGTEIAYNWMHDNKALRDAYGKVYAPGIYLDNGSSNFLVHHNVVWNTAGQGIFLNDPSTNQQIYSNTLWNNTGMAIEGLGMVNVRAYNNLSDKGFDGTDLRSNLTSSNPRFVDSANGNFQLQSNSPAINQGAIILGITDSHTGSAPDIGAYEFGGVSWIAGVKVTPVPPPALPPPPPYQANPIGWWKLDEGLGTTATDSSGK